MALIPAMFHNCSVIYDSSKYPLLSPKLDVHNHTFQFHNHINMCQSTCKELKENEESDKFGLLA